MTDSKIVVAIIVHDRFQNIREWVRCWNMCDTKGAQLVVIHNYLNKEERDAYSKFCSESQVTYVSRKNIGMDIGALQDVFMERLTGFPNDWDYLIWATDDALPMRKDFVYQYVKKLNDSVGVACMEVSPQVRLHIRTTGFVISKELSRKITFPVDPMITKVQCYEFEHRSTNNFMDQVKKLGYEAIQTDSLKRSLLWDTGRHKSKYIDRNTEHYQHFPKI